MLLPTAILCNASLPSFVRVDCMALSVSTSTCRPAYLSISQHKRGPQAPSPTMALRPTAKPNHFFECPLGATSPAGAISEQECKCVLEGWRTLSDNVCTCLPGYARDMHNICRPCENGTFYAGGDLPAQMCPANSNSHVGATKISDCLCDAGYSGAGD